MVIVDGDTKCTEHTFRQKQNISANRYLNIYSYRHKAKKERFTRKIVPQQQSLKNITAIMGDIARG